MIGTTLSHYRILAKIGEGGMGVVYRALDTRLDRTVALKVLRPETVGDPERKWRFIREAKAASALNHPHIVTIHDVDADQGVDFMVMEFVEGTPLNQLISAGGLPVHDAVDIAVRIASALGAAHAAGIVHRDVKPANVVVGEGGRVKVLDFGLAKLVERGSGPDDMTSDSTATAASIVERTREGVILGTVAYMSPEQAEGKPLDARSDVFSLGAVMHEMLTGRRPFQGDSYLRTLTAILRDAPPPLGTVRPDVPAALERIVTRSLAKRPEDRFSTAGDVEKELAALGGRTVAAASRPVWKRPVAVAAACLLLAAAGLGAWRLAEASRVRRVREKTLPEIVRLVEQQKFVDAWRLAREAERTLPAEVERLRRENWVTFTVTTDPPGAEASFAPYLEAESGWTPAGKTPLKEFRLPLAYYRWRFTLSGHQTVEGTTESLTAAYRLDPVSAVPPGMVRVPGGPFSLRSLGAVTLGDFWLDRTEVTNREFKAFVDAGGYARREYWKQPFVKEGRTLSFEEAVAGFRDTTGRPGPATWELGTYPEGREDFPVSGVSWYEAAACAEFAGKSLPTIYHWYHATGSGNFSEILRASNFAGKGPAPVATYKGLGPYGTYDMAGNVKEWCWNEAGGRRYLLGGAFSDAVYQYSEPDAQVAFDRSPLNGFRCVRHSAPPSEEQLREIPFVARDFSKEKPVADDVFRVFQGFYAYDKGPLDVKSEGVDDSSPYWRKEKVSFLAASGGGRIPAFLFLPKNARPPYQTVVYFPSSQARVTPSSSDLDVRFIDFVVRSGRALLHPIYNDTYERRIAVRSSGPAFFRDLRIQWSKELGRSIDFIETRPDLDKGALAYYGLSLGAIDGVIFVALEPRIRTAVLAAGGLRFVRVPPEVEPFNFAPRIKVPVLLIAGRYDFGHPYETMQVPLFRALGTPERDKKHVAFEGGHIPPKIQSLIKEILDWLDRTLGPVPRPG